MSEDCDDQPETGDSFCSVHQRRFHCKTKKKDFKKSVQISMAYETRSPPTGGAKRNAAPLGWLRFGRINEVSNFKIYKKKWVGSVGLHFLTGRDVISYFRSLPNYVNVSTLRYVDTVISRRPFNRFWRGWQFRKELFKRFVSCSASCWTID